MPKHFTVILLVAACTASPEPSEPDLPLDEDAEQEEDVPPACGQATDACAPGEQIACDALGTSWAGGTATCRSDCTAWGVESCTRRAAIAFETVRPAERETRWEGARCNDGTPFSFQVRLAAQPSTAWVVYLQGGVYCDDLSKPCRLRDPKLTTTSPEPDKSISTTDREGVLSSSAQGNPTFAGANHIYAHYCSSDMWSGATIDRRPTGAAAQGWYFSGHANVRAMLEILRDRYGLDDSDVATKLLFGGGSAGAFGAHNNASIAEAMLPIAAAAGRVKLFIDAGWMTLWDDPQHRVGDATVADLEVWGAARTFWGATFDPDCEASEPDPARCFVGVGWYPHVSARLPVLVQQSSADGSFMSIHGIGDPTTQTAWQQQTASELANADWLFSGSSSYHTLAGRFSGLDMGPADATLRDVLAAFWTGSGPRHITF